MSAYSRQKGSEFERWVARHLTEAGVPSKRVVGSGAHAKQDSRLTGDVQLGTLDNGHWLLTAECKWRKNADGFKLLEGWLGDNDVLLVRRNQKPNPDVFMSWDTFKALLVAFYEDETNASNTRPELRKASGASDPTSPDTGGVEEHERAPIEDA